MSDDVQVFQADPRHIDEMRLILDPTGGSEEEAKQLGRQMENAVQKWAVRREGRLLAIGAAVPAQPGVVQLVTLFRPDLSWRDVKAVYVISHAFLRELDRGREIHRKQFVIRTDFGKCHKWAQKLGFAPEGILRQYDPQRNDYIMFAQCHPKQQLQ